MRKMVLTRGRFVTFFHTMTVHILHDCGILRDSSETVSVLVCLGVRVMFESA